jgi:crotonobetainyl-CoA:carnitine CoA-transferase CaiB-like acyl-CoA transferase
MLATASDAQFSRLCIALDKPLWARDPRFATMAARLANREQLDEVLSTEFRSASIESWLARLGAAGLSVGAVHDIRQALATPVVDERQLFVDPIRLGWTNGLPLWRLPIDPDGAGVKNPPPELGEHTAEVLNEFGFDAAAIERLRVKTRE